MRAVRRQRDAGIALVPDPRVAVVVVAPGLKPLGQRGGHGGHHGAARRAQPAQHGIGMPRVHLGDQVTAVGDNLRPGFLGRGPQHSRIGRRIAKVTIRNLQNEFMLRPLRQLHRHRKAAADVACLARPRPAEPQRAAAPRPHVPVLCYFCHPLAAEPGARLEEDRDLGRPVDRLDPPQQHGAVRVGGHGEGLAALDPRVADPAAVPDQGPALVVAAPDVPRVGGRDRVPAGPAEQPAEHGRAVPARRAQPPDRPVWPDDRPPLPVRNQRVLSQHPRHEPLARRAISSVSSSHAVLTSTSPRPHAATAPGTWRPASLKGRNKRPCVPPGQLRFGLSCHRAAGCGPAPEAWPEVSVKTRARVTG